MDTKERLERLESLKQKYMLLREFVVYYRYAMDYNASIEEEKEKTQENVKVKKLVLTKPFYGKNLQVG